MFESQFSRRSPLVSRRFTIAGPPSTFHASATSFPFPICIFIFISNERREPRSSSSSMIVHSPRNALPLADFDKNSSSMTPFPDTLFCSAFKYREKVVRVRSKLMFREENKPNERSIKTPLFFFSPPLFIPITIIYTYIWYWLVGVEDQKIGKLGRASSLEKFDDRERIGSPVSRRFNSYYSWKRRGVYTRASIPGEVCALGADR